MNGEAEAVHSGFCSGGHQDHGGTDPFLVSRELVETAAGSRRGPAERTGLGGSVAENEFFKGVASSDSDAEATSWVVDVVDDGSEQAVHQVRLVCGNAEVSGDHLRWDDGCHLGDEVEGRGGGER